MKKITPARAALWIIAIAVSLFLCHASRRLLPASENQQYFTFRSSLAKFSDMVMYAAYQQMPASYSSCINHLRQLDGAKQQWALEQNRVVTSGPTWKEIAPYVGRNPAAEPQELPWCPQGGFYILGRIDEAPRCTYPGHKLE